MLIDWPKLLAALALLLTPIAVFHGKRVRYRSLERDWSDYYGRSALLVHHLFDLLRAAAGAWLLFEALKVAPGAKGAIRYAPLLVQIGTLVVATTLQTVVCKEPEAIHAPFAFVTGLVAGFVPPLVAGFAILTALVVSFGTRVAVMFFPILAVAVAGMGFFFTGKKYLFVLIPVVCALPIPWLWSLLFQRGLVSSHLAKSNPPRAEKSAQAPTTKPGAR